MARKADKCTEALRRLEELAKQYGKAGTDSLALDLTKAPERWQRTLLALGRERAYEALAGFLCRAFLLRNGRPFLFSDQCVARELGYHIDAYFWTRGYQGFRRPLTTLLFSRAALARHCRTVEIEEKDLHDIRQRLIFRYRRGVKERQLEEKAKKAAPPNAPGNRKNV